MAKTLRSLLDKHSRLVLALDPPREASNPVDWCLNIIRMVRGVPVAYKLGLPLVARVGFKDVRRLIGEYSDEYWIADMKLADIGYISSLVVEEAASTGFNAVIAHSFIGFKGALELIADKCREHGVELITVVSMSHEGSRDLLDRSLLGLLDASFKAGASGLIVPATRPSIIRVVRRIVGSNMVLLAPGVGAQGAKPGQAIMAGADLEIAGRIVTRDENPKKRALEIVEEQRRALCLLGRSCTGMGAYL